MLYITDEWVGRPPLHACKLLREKPRKMVGVPPPPSDIAPQTREDGSLGCPEGSPCPHIHPTWTPDRVQVSPPLLMACACRGGLWNTSAYGDAGNVVWKDECFFLLPSVSDVSELEKQQARRAQTSRDVLPTQRLSSASRPPPRNLALFRNSEQMWLLTVSHAVGDIREIGKLCTRPDGGNLLGWRANQPRAYLHPSPGSTTPSRNRLGGQRYGTRENCY